MASSVYSDPVSESHLSANTLNTNNNSQETSLDQNSRNDYFNARSALKTTGAVLGLGIGAKALNLVGGKKKRRRRTKKSKRRTRRRYSSKFRRRSRSRRYNRR